MYTTVVGLHTSGQTQQNDLVFQLWACSTQKGGGNYHSAGEHRKVWTTNLKKQESKPNLYDALANPSNRGLHVDQKNLNRQEAVGEKKPLHFFGLMQYDSLSPLETLGSIQVWIVSGKNVSELRPVSSGHCLRYEVVVWRGGNVQKFCGKAGGASAALHGKDVIFSTCQVFCLVAVKKTNPKNKTPSNKHLNMQKVLL